MANIQIAGFQPHRKSGGGRISYRRARVLTNNTTAIALYDAVSIGSAGETVVASAVDTAISSVSGGASYVDTAGARVGAKVLPAATLYTSSGVAPENASYVFVVDNSLEVDYLCSIDEATTLTQMNLNYKMVLGANTNGISGHELDATTPATTATFPWRVQDFVISADSDPDAADAHVLAKINAGMWEPALEIGGSLGS